MLYFIQYRVHYTIIQCLISMKHGICSALCLSLSFSLSFSLITRIVATLKRYRDIRMLRQSRNTILELRYFEHRTDDAIATDYVCVSVRWTHKCIESKRLDLLYKFVVDVYTSLYVPHPLHLWAQELSRGCCRNARHDRRARLPPQDERFHFSAPSRESGTSRESPNWVAGVILQIPNNHRWGVITRDSRRAAKLRSSLEGRTSNIWRASTLSILPATENGRLRAPAPRVVFRRFAISREIPVLGFANRTRTDNKLRAAE